MSCRAIAGATPAVLRVIVVLTSRQARNEDKRPVCASHQTIADSVISFVLERSPRQETPPPTTPLGSDPQSSVEIRRGILPAFISSQAAKDSLGLCKADVPYNQHTSSASVGSFQPTVGVVFPAGASERQALLVTTVPDDPAAHAGTAALSVPGCCCETVRGITAIVDPKL